MCFWSGYFLFVYKCVSVSVRFCTIYWMFCPDVLDDVLLDYVTLNPLALDRSIELDPSVQ